MGSSRDNIPMTHSAISAVALEINEVRRIISFLFLSPPETSDWILDYTPACDEYRFHSTPYFLQPESFFNVVVYHAGVHLVCQVVLQKAFVCRRNKMDYSLKVRGKINLLRSYVSALGYSGALACTPIFNDLSFRNGNRKAAHFVNWVEFKAIIINTLIYYTVSIFVLNIYYNFF